MADLLERAIAMRAAQKAINADSTERKKTFCERKEAEFDYWMAEMFEEYKKQNQTILIK